MPVTAEAGRISMGGRERGGVGNTKDGGGGMGGKRCPEEEGGTVGGGKGGMREGNKGSSTRYGTTGCGGKRGSHQGGRGRAKGGVMSGGVQRGEAGEEGSGGRGQGRGAVAARGSTEDGGTRRPRVPRGAAAMRLAPPRADIIITVIFLLTGPPRGPRTAGTPQPTGATNLCISHTTRMTPKPEGSGMLPILPPPPPRSPSPPPPECSVECSLDRG